MKGIEPPTCRFASAALPLSYTSTAQSLTSLAYGPAGPSAPGEL